MHQYKRIGGAGVATGAGADSDNAIHSGFCRLAGVFLIGDIVEHQPAIAVHGFHHLAGCAQRRNHNRYLMLYAQLQIRLPARVGAVHHQVHGIGRGCRARLLRLPLRQLVIHLHQPLLETLTAALVQGRKAAYDAGFATGKGQAGRGDQKHGGGNQWKTKCIVELCRNWHVESLIFIGTFSSYGGS